jgi:hypothetical protein
MDSCRAMTFITAGTTRKGLPEAKRPAEVMGGRILDLFDRLASRPVEPRLGSHPDAGLPANLANHLRNGFQLNRAGVACWLVQGKHFAVPLLGRGHEGVLVCPDLRAGPLAHGESKNWRHKYRRLSHQESDSRREDGWHHPALRFGHGQTAGRRTLPREEGPRLYA